MKKRGPARNRYDLGGTQLGFVVRRHIILDAAAAAELRIGPGGAARGAEPLDDMEGPDFVAQGARLAVLVLAGSVVTCTSA